MAKTENRGPDLRIHPPFLFLMPLGAGLLVQHYVPIEIVSSIGAAKILDYVGVAEIFIGASLAAWAVATLRRLGTHVVPMHDATVLADAGPYTLTRNPIYLAFAIIYVGITFVLNAFWPLLFLPEAIVFTYLFAIKREEEYLSREFGDSYAAYREIGRAHV